MHDNKTQESPEQRTARQQRYAQSMPKTISDISIEARMTRPNFQIEVRRYNWDKVIAPTPFKIDICYLELALIPRPEGSKISFLNSTNPTAFMPTGNCSFIPAGQQTIMQPSLGKQLVVGCMFDAAVFEPFIDWQWTPLEIAACFNIQNIHIRNALSQLSQEVLNPDYQSAQLVDALFQYILVELSRHLRSFRKSNNPYQGRLSKHQLQLIDMLIYNATGEFPQTSELAKQCNISHRHLARMFKQTTGKTLTEYITEIKMDRAKNLLLNSHDLIKEVAYKCGFKSQSAFAQAFKTATGLSPRQFKTPQNTENNESLKGQKTIKEH